MRYSELNRPRALTRVILMLTLAVTMVSHAGCGDSSTPPAASSVTTPTPATAAAAASTPAVIDVAPEPTKPKILLNLEKTQLKFGFIKLTDCAALVIAKEMGFFEEEGLFVTLEAQANWKILLDRVISGELDGAHMLAGQPIGATIGVGTQAHVITPFSMDLNGNGITVSNEIWGRMKSHDPSLQKERQSLQTSLDTLVANTGADPADFLPMPKIDGSVLGVETSVAPGLVAINAGSNQGVKRGFTFEVFDGGTYKGQVRVEFVHADMCSGLITRTVQGQSIRQGDGATTRL